MHAIDLARADRGPSSSGFHMNASYVCDLLVVGHMSEQQLGKLRKVLGL